MINSKINGRRRVCSYNHNYLLFIITFYYSIYWVIVAAVIYRSFILHILCNARKDKHIMI